MNKQVVIAGLKRLERHLRKQAQHEDYLAEHVEGAWVSAQIKSECYNEVADLVHAEVTKLEKSDARTSRSVGITQSRRTVNHDGPQFPSDC